VLTKGTEHYLPEVPVTIDRAHTGQPTLGYFNLTYRPQRDGQGQITGIVTIAQEVTEQVVARQLVGQLNRELTVANEELIATNEELATVNEELAASNEEYLRTNAALNEAQQQLQHLNAELEGRVQKRILEFQQQQRLLHQILAQVPAAVATLHEPEHRFSFFNDRYAALTGHRATLQQTVAEALPEVVEQGFIDLLDHVYTRGEPFIGKEIAIVLEQPTGPPVQRHLDFTYQPLTDPHGRVQGILVFIIDVSEQVRVRQQVQATNKALHAANARLTRTNADLDTFVYIASHDLKAPITNIEGLLLALRQQLPAAALQAELVPRLFEMMEGAVARFQQTIGHLTTISQLPLSEVLETVDLRALIEDVRLDLAPLLEMAPAFLSITVDGCEAVRVAPKTLRSVVYNLLSNAVKYRDAARPAQIQVRAQCLPGHVVLAVQDNGLGLTDFQQGELFGMFRRMHTHVEGSGVGLFTLKRLVDNAGGTVTVESQPGVGSTFTVSLPT
jgi:signal transduction histidine kinase